VEKIVAKEVAKRRWRVANQKVYNRKFFRRLVIEVADVDGEWAVVVRGCRWSKDGYCLNPKDALTKAQADTLCRAVQDQFGGIERLILSPVKKNKGR